ncbi:hypothetical protein lerEdw1_010621 [Lerista edwardsae]|nr:hypothetical protein lerEdw1_010623 [Lerista edwardsae]KAJ6650386.1 hypothetical protein lerEdw1_010621 [Lerista edwardsae]
MHWVDCSLLLALTAAAVGKLIGCVYCQQDTVPWHASLRSMCHLCSGALINQEWVLTAAQCSKSSPDKLEIWLGKDVCEASEAMQQVISAAKVIPHQQFNGYTLEYDIMLVKLMHPAVLDGLVQPISLPSQCSPAGTKCLTSECSCNHTNGSGGPLQCTNLTITADATCHNAYPGRFTEKMLCAGQLGSDQDSCKGEVGSPLVCGGALQGLLSWSNSCSAENHLGLYTKICVFRDWIDCTIVNN